MHRGGLRQHPFVTVLSLLRFYSEHRLLFMGRRLLNGAWQGEEGLTTLDGIAMSWAYLEELSSKTGFIYDPEGVEKMRAQLTDLGKPAHSDMAILAAYMNGETPLPASKPALPSGAPDMSELDQLAALMQAPPTE